MPFEEKLPEWNAPGIEPPASKKNTGWTPGEKPPAEYWNWQMHRTYMVLKELREKVAEAQDLINHISSTTGVHGATSAATPNTIVQRDANQQAKFGTPTDAAHAATKGYVDATFLPAAGGRISGNLAFQNTGTGLQLRRGDQESRLHIADFPEAETVDIEARFFRIANTSGAKEVTIFRGDGTPTSTFKVRNGRIVKLDEQDITIAAGPNSPEGSLSAPPGSLYLRTNGEMWLKKTGTGNTGWGRVEVS